ncbi:TetR/AcrR family transcriptional regulator [Nocardia cyriacigeorgica]|uniref:TetR/AcrR family transcriptional regulator n=1 Tax=Nocardia cyriacigeorgica TaxID=135487 RepID=A0A6P1D160_9NOCA|nr:TetR/AcrR family transcriptional regulator [Nocardia cyriacigeorgica]NEW44226.1 TetR/AcrR family transcriptional regulator [Nocardia cyriacigeorgica]NEW56956.1 TetR/AcrR family transcriptional regulator [Nocardia cyriacigeorgica]
MRANTNLRDEQKQQTRARLIDAAKELFAARGYAAVRVDDIAAAVGCSRATFYLHFAGKLEILRVIGEQGTAPTALHFYEDLDRVLETGSRAEFARWVGSAIEWFHEYKDLLPAWDEATALEPEFREIARNGISALPDSMTAYLAGWPADRRDEARLRVELLVAQLERFFTRWAMLGTIDVSVDRAIEVLTDIWFPALRPPLEG